jgi:hypothetical protein
MIYAVTEEDDQRLVKVGVTNTPDGRVRADAIMRRLGALQVGTWRPLVCIAACEGNVDVEKELHLRFDRYWARGEWFHNQGIVAKWVNAHLLPSPVKAKKVPRLHVPERPLVSERRQIDKWSAEEWAEWRKWFNRRPPARALR